MIIAKMQITMTLELMLPLPGLTKEEAEAEVSTDEAKTSFTKHVTDHLAQIAEKSGGCATVSEASIIIVEV